MTRSLYFILFLLHICLLGIAQEPYTVRIKSEQLEAQSIYSIAQDKEGRIWATSRGYVAMYDGFQVKKIVDPDYLRQSYFVATTSPKGEVYCSTLSGKIYQCTPDSLLLYYSLPDSLATNRINLKFTKDNNLIIAANGIHLLSKDKQLTAISGDLPSQYEYFDFDGNVKYFNTTNRIDGQQNLITKATDGDLISKMKMPDSLSGIGGNTKYLRNGFTFHNTAYFYYLKDQDHLTTLYHLIDGKIEPIELPLDKQWGKIRPRFYTTENFLIVADPYVGAWVYDKNLELAFGDYQIFKTLNISSAIEDQQGNLWLGTIGNGLHLINDFNTFHYKYHPKLGKETAVSLAANFREKTLHLGCASGKIYDLKRTYGPPVYENNRAVMQIFYFKEHSFFILNNSLVLENGTKLPLTTTPSALVYDLTMYDDTTVLYGHFGGINSFRISPSGEVSTDIGNLQNTRFLDISSSTGSIDFDRKNNVLWTTNSKGTFCINTETGKFNSCDDTLGIKPILKGIADASRKLYTDGNRVYLIKNMAVVDTVAQKGQILASHQRLFHGVSKNDLYVFRPPVMQYYDYTKDSSAYYLGLSSVKRITSSLNMQEKTMVIDNRRLLVSFQPNRVYTGSKTTISFSNITYLGEDYTTVIDPELDHEQNSLKFNFFSNAYLPKNALKYFYKVDGLDNDWIQVPEGRNFVEFPHLPPGDFEFQLKALCPDGTETKIERYSFSVKTPWFKSWWFFVLLGLIISSIVYYRFKLIKDKNKIEHSKRLAEIRAIKAQMNPHFMYNALNSVQDLILQKDIPNSINYLGKFSNLMRRTLDYSARDEVSVEKEIELLTLYLDLEKLRFGDEFTYHITTNFEDRTDEYRVPAMLLQPYTENALKHGLLHRDGDKILNIDFNALREKLIITIKDNGIGRIRSQEINERRNKEHQSFATTAAESRLQLIQDATGKNIGLEIIDLDNHSGTIIQFTFEV